MRRHGTLFARALVRGFASVFVLVFVLLLAPRVANARTIEWTKIEVADGDDKPRIRSRLKKELARATRNAKWGSGDKLQLQAKVTKLSWSKHDDVLKLTVTVVAKIEGGKGARSHIRLGAHLNERSKLERQVLRIVAGGLVTRLSDIARRGDDKGEDEGKGE